MGSNFHLCVFFAVFIKFHYIIVNIVSTLYDVPSTWKELILSVNTIHLKNGLMYLILGGRFMKNFRYSTISMLCYIIINIMLQYYKSDTY